MPYADVRRPRRDTAHRSPYGSTRDGTWKFAYADARGPDAPTSTAPTPSDGDWDTHPGSVVWQLHGHDFPIY
ncbi:hypothetical protein GCM10023238_08230 [Streptomyces heliomycini]